MRTSGVGIARERHASDDLTVPSFRHEHGGVWIAAKRLQIASLVSDAAPLAVRRDQPAFRLRAHCLRQSDEGFCVRRIRRPYIELERHATIPDPPRRKSPEADARL